MVLLQRVYLGYCRILYAPEIADEDVAQVVASW